APTTGDAATTDATTGSSSSGTTRAVSDTGDASTSTSSTSSTSSTGEESSTSTGEEPPVDLCAHQDDPPPAVIRKAINDDPRFIQVYDDNIENLKLAGEQCAGDWTDLIYYMKTIEPSPDVFLVQQISDPAQLEVLVDRLETELPGLFEGFISDAEPWPQMSPCGKEKALQTNAIILRTGRFEVVGDKHVWQSWANKDGECVRNNQARTRNVMVKLHDKIADKHVTVASMHWSTSQGAGDDPACAEANVLEVDEKLHKAGFGGDMVIFGGDFNESDRNDMGDFRAWYKLANGDGGGALNYRDPIYRMCDATDNLKDCLDDNDTGGKRIDMLFAQDQNGCRVRTARAHTITYAEAEAAAKQLSGDSDPDLHYSEHRALRAEFYY
ncbi:MAG TPA: hypothetical protein VGB85_06900, partial [Nannocystis sp.]